MLFGTSPRYGAGGTPGLLGGGGFTYGIGLRSAGKVLPGDAGILRGRPSQGNKTRVSFAVTFSSQSLRFLSRPLVRGADTGFAFASLTFIARGTTAFAAAAGRASFRLYTHEATDARARATARLVVTAVAATALRIVATISAATAAAGGGFAVPRKAVRGCPFNSSEVSCVLNRATSRVT